MAWDRWALFLQGVAVLLLLMAWDRWALYLQGVAVLLCIGVFFVLLRWAGG